MSRAVVALVLLVALTAALQIAGALRIAEPSVACGLCHDATVVDPASTSGLGDGD
jgi:hypothetical protein